jgi:hypothetical protein
MTTPRLPVLLAFAATALAAAPAAQAAAPAPSLIGRAILPADASAPAPFPGIVDTDPAPAPGSTQPVGGFSALIDAGAKDTYWAMPDNGFGSKANSRSFLLRLYKVRELHDRPRRQRRRPDPEVDHAPRPRPQAPVRHRQRCHPRPPADRRRLRHRVGPPDQAR